MDDEQAENESTNDEKIQLKSRALSETSTLPKGGRRKTRKYSADIPIPISPQKKGHSGRKATQLTEQQQDNIR